ncbi:MAG: hypothetical protein ABII18_07745 [bacterium]
MILKKLSQRTGSVMIPAVITMLILSYASISMIQMQTSGLMQASNHLNKTQAQKIAIAGAEWSKTLINGGNNPVTNGKNLGTGILKITTVPNQGVVNMMSSTNTAKASYTIVTDFATDCVSFQNIHTFSFGDTIGHINNVQVRKTCLDKIIIDKVMVSWTDPSAAQRVMKIDMNSSIYYDAYVEPSTGEPSEGANSDIVIDINNIVMTGTGYYTFNYFEFEYTVGNAPPPGTDFTITFYFGDGSSYNKLFDNYD